MEHTIENVRASLEVTRAKDVSEIEKPSHRLIDEYDDDGNYIGDDPRFM